MRARSIVPSVRHQATVLPRRNEPARTAQREAADVRRRAEVRDECLQRRASGIERGRRDVGEEHVEQGLERGTHSVVLLRPPAAPCPPDPRATRSR